ncbi:hypothetical protein Taro_014071 [Colocasia esculenta]|uniref:Uncharacterized protein n=1 Tax=Colocasia esculenta TaxID=4460 RepID=A0A843UDX1_COLES|nr:hypothetical protein [Colocasia esculenta]
MSLVCLISYSPATKSSSTQPQQVLNSSLGVVSTLDQVVSTPCSKPKTKIGKTGQVVSTLVQVVSTQCLKYKAKRSSRVDTSPVSTLDQVVSTPCSKPKTKTSKTGQVVSTLVQVVSTQCLKYKAKRSSRVDTSPGSVDTRDSFQKTFRSIWDSVSTLA